MSNITLLCRATIKLWLSSASDAYRKSLLVWWGAFFPVLYFIIILILSKVALLLGNLAGGFVLGMTSAFLLAHYLSLVGSAVRGEKTSLNISLNDAKEIFIPLVSVLFFLFLVGLLLSFVTKGFNSVVIFFAVNLALVIFLNAVCEICYLDRPHAVTYVFSRSYQFVVDNFLEWFLPQVLIFLPLVLVDPERFIVSFAASSPTYAVMFFLTSFSSFVGPGLIYVLPLLVLVFYLMVFRGVLYSRLSRSSRRKRIFSERM